MMVRYDDEFLFMKMTCRWQENEHILKVLKPAWENNKNKLLMLLS